MNLTGMIETILFVHADPIDLKTLMRNTKHKEKEVREALGQLTKDYAGRGIILIQNNDTWQFATHPAYAACIEDLMKHEYTQELSRSALETLSIIAYKGPLTRIEIEYIRGVHSSFTLRNLLMRGLIERIENPKDARSYVYRVTIDFLKHFGLTSMEALPQFKEFHSQVIEILEESNGETKSQSL